MNVVLFGPTDIPRASPRIVNRTSRRGVGDDYLGSLFSRNNRHTIVAFTKEKGTMINVIYNHYNVPNSTRLGLCHAGLSARTINFTIV